MLKRTRCLQSWLDPGSGTETDELEETTGEVAEVRMKPNQKPLTSRTFLSATEAEHVGMIEDVGLS